MESVLPTITATQNPKTKKRTDRVLPLVEYKKKARLRELSDYKFYSLK